jgi:hypothetical protein
MVKYIDFRDIDNFDNGYSVYDGHEVFKEFLEENSILDKFIENFNKSGKIWRIRFWDGYEDNNEYTLNNYLNNKKPLLYISDAFQWDISKEGYSFWCEIGYKWYKNQIY